MDEITLPTAILTIEEAKYQLRTEIEGELEDSLIQDAIDTATEHIEHETRRIIVPRTFTTISHPSRWLPTRSLLQVPNTPLLSATISYQGVLGPVTLDPETYWINAEGLISLATPITDQSLTIEYVAGYAKIPPCAKHVAKLLVGDFYWNREATSDGSLKELPIGIRRLLAPLRKGSYA